MKRIAVLLLCLCMILPMAFVMVFSAGATTVAPEAPLVSTDKAVYLPGEEIKVTATKTVEGSWVGIVPADKDGNPIISQGTIYWENIPAEGLTDLSIKGHNTLSGGKADALAELMSVSKDEMLNLCAGRYFMAHISSSEGIVAATNEDPDLVTYVPFTVADKITMEKTTFKYGEDILVTPVYKNGEKDYVGISHVKDDGTIGQNLYYTYITDANLNTPIAIQDGVLYGDDKETYGRLPAGRYVVYFAPNNAGAGSRDKSSDIYIDVVGATVEKTEFHYGEPIMVTGYGAGKDWVGISQYDSSTESGYWSNGSIRWRYIEPVDGKSAAQNGFGSGVAFDIREAHLAAAAASRGDLPVGEYVIFVGLDDCYAKDVSPYTEIKITITAEKPDAPTAVGYELNDKRTGLAGGKLTVTFDDAAMEMHKKPTQAALYWADAEGNMVGREIGTYAITGAETEITMPGSLIIPAEAKKLMVRAYNGSGTAETVSVDLPADRSYRTVGEKLASFQIVSDVHIGNGTFSSDHATALFNDILTIDPDSVGIFVAGDLADNGRDAEFEEFFALWQASGLDAKPYLGVGNHEMYVNGHNYNNDYQVQIERFLTYANKSLTEAEKTETPYYYVNRGGQHFIFLGTEYCGTHAYLSDAQLDWLEAKLGEVAADGAPVFIMLHQGLYNSIAGTLEGQGWNGIIAGDANFAAWEALVAEKGVTNSNHTYMKGQYEQPLRDILAQYPSAMMFSGHSHWVMESYNNMYEATEEQPNYFFNTASVSYLWTDDGDMNGGHGTDEGSQAYYVTVYENCIEVRGRDILNGEWITGASYQVWLECVHEGETLCDTVCKWCGETNTNAIPCDGENACDTVCKYCGGETVADAVACTGEFDCSTKCMHCGKAVTPRVETHSFAHECTAVCGVCGEANPDVKECTGEFDCSTKCKYCGEAVTPRVEGHTFTYLCTALCEICGEANPDVVDCSGAFDCSTKCQYCNEAVTPVVDTHTFTYACTDVCEICGEANPDAVACEGAFDCSTKCKYCNEAVTPVVDTHTVTYACDENCGVCGEAVEHEEHAGLYACSDKCQYCGIDVAHEEHVGENGCAIVCKYGCGTAVTGTGHEREFACSAVCKNCGEDMTDGAAAHEGASACATVCKYGCGTAVTPDPEATHAGAFDCSENCAACGEAIEPKAAHDGEFDCSVTCKYCGEDAVTDAVACDGAFECSTICKYCGEATVADAIACEGEFACSTKCKYCNEETITDAIPCDGEYDCSVICKYCGEESVADAIACDGEFECSTVCKYCNEETVADAVACDGAVDCSNVCKYCGEETVTDAVPCDGEFACSTTCQYCGEENITDAVACEGEFDCSTLCKYGCGNAVVPRDPNHTAPFECSAVCIVCGEAVGHVDHEAEFVCSTVCKYGCGTALEPTTEHVNAVACSEQCDVCGEAVPATEEHVHAYNCSQKCANCGEAITSTEEHVNGIACSEKCDVCGEAVVPTEEHAKGQYQCTDTCTVCGEEILHKEHSGEFACSKYCQYGCGLLMEDAVLCVGEMPCVDSICKYCGLDVKPLAHAGDKVCSTVCKYGCGTTVRPKKEHTVENGCATVCLHCGETWAQKAHQYTDSCDVDCNNCGFVRETSHKYANSCAVACSVCGYERVTTGHVYISQCAEECKICHEQREDFAPHDYQSDCDTGCDVCGKSREKGEHTFGEWVEITAATTEKAGLREHECLFCGEIESEEIPVVPPQQTDDSATDTLDVTAPVIITVPLLGEVDKSIFISGAVAAVAALLLIIVLFAVLISKGKKKKKAAKAAAQQAPAEEVIAEEVIAEEAVVEEAVVEEAPVEATEEEPEGEE